MVNFYVNLSQTHYLKVFLIYLVISILLYFIVSYVLITESLFFDFYGSQLSYERIVDLISEQKRWKLLIYFILPIVLLIQFLLISSVIIGGLLVGSERFEFPMVFKSVVVAEFFLLVPLVIKLIWFGFIYREYSFADLQSFSPLSVASFFDLSQQPKWALPSLQSASLFLLGYIFIIAYSLSELLARPFAKMLGIVVSSYGSAWLVFQVFIVFVLINLS